jgi:hypothetical protein
MTNTTIAHTLTGPVCAKCSTGSGKDRVQRRHATIADIKACFTAGTQLAMPVEVPAVPSPAQVEELFAVEDAKKFGRFFAQCYRTGCKTHAVKDHYFTLRCYKHGKTVKVKAKQLWGKVSTAAKHHCDDRCISAKGNLCVCQCGGVNHGVGLLVTAPGVKV